MKIKLLLLFILITSHCVAQDENGYIIRRKSGWQEHELSGKVKEMSIDEGIKTIPGNYFRMLEMAVTTHHTFDAQGNVLTIETSRKDIETQNEVRFPDCEYSYSPDGILLTKKQYNYNTYTLSYKMVHLDPYGNLTGVSEYLLYANEEKPILNDTIRHETRVIGHRQEATYYDGKLDETTTYDQYRNPLLIVGKLNEWFQKYENCYDSKGNMTRCVEYEKTTAPDEENAIYSIMTYTYDKHSKLLFSSYQRGEGYVYERQYEYNKYGCQIDSGVYKYTYDKHGNWVEAIPIVRGIDKKVRRFIYYE